MEADIIYLGNLGNLKNQEAVATLVEISDFVEKQHENQYSHQKLIFCKFFITSCTLGLEA